MGQRPDEIRQEAGSGDEVVQTRVEIEQTRADMSETVDAIQERLSPQNLKEQAKSTVQEATTEAKDRAREDAVQRARGAKATIMSTIKQNPVPVVLTGIGLGWLAVSSRQQSSGQGVGGSSSGQAVKQAQGRARETASHAQDRARQTAGQAQQQVSRLGHQAQDRAQGAKGGFQRMLQENPLAVGAIAVGLGTAVGLAIPETSKENQVMGGARDNLAERAQQKAQDTKNRVQQVAEQAKSTAQEEAQNQGLTG